MLIFQGRQIPDRDLAWKFSRSSGPGGQHVNTSDTRVQLTFDLANCDALSASTKERLLERLGSSVTITASEHRSQMRNREAALERLTETLERALVRQVARRATRPTRGSQRRRVDAKKRRGETKKLRGRITD